MFCGLGRLSRAQESMTVRKLKFAWKYRKCLWKYRKVLRHRKAIVEAVLAVGAAGVAWAVLRGTSSASMASNG